MIRMPSLPVRQNHHARTHLAQHPHNLLPVFQRIFDCTIRQIQRLAPAHSQQLRSLRCLARPIFRRPARPSLAPRQVQNRSPQSARRHPQQGAAASLLHIVAVSRDRKYVSARFGVFSQAGRPK